MATLFSGYITLDKLKEIAKVVESKGEKGFKFTGSINDQSNEYGNNVSLYAEQSKEQRESKANRYFFSNGSVFWTDGKVTLAEKKSEVAKSESPNNVEDDLLF